MVQTEIAVREEAATTRLAILEEQEGLRALRYQLTLKKVAVAKALQAPVPVVRVRIVRPIAARAQCCRRARFCRVRLPSCSLTPVPNRPPLRLAVRRPGVAPGHAQVRPQVRVGLVHEPLAPEEALRGPGGRWGQDGPAADGETGRRLEVVAGAAPRLLAYA